MHARWISLSRRIVVASAAVCLMGVSLAPAQEENDLDLNVTAPLVDNAVERVELELSADDAINTGVLWLTAQQENYWLGVQVAAADDALRAQLGIEQGQGLVVSEVTPKSPADEAGLQPHDVLLTIAGRPLPDSAALEKQIDAAGNASAPIEFLRGGKRFTIEVTPRQRDWQLSTIAFNADRFQIGVSMSVADDTLRAQLGLADDTGLVVTNVQPESPAAAAGIQLHDVLLEFGGKRLAKVEDLTTQVQEVGEKPATMKILRAGVEESFSMTPTQNDELSNFIVTLNELPSAKADSTFVVAGEALVDPTGTRWSTNADLSVDAEAEDSDPLRELIDQVKQLNQRIEALEKSIQETQQ